MSKLCVGDLVTLRDDELYHEPGVVTEVKDLRYPDQGDARLCVVSAVFGDECLTLAERDFVLLQKLEENA